MRIANARKQRGYYQFDLYINTAFRLLRLRFNPETGVIYPQRRYWARRKKWLDVYKGEPRFWEQVREICKEKWPPEAQI